MQLHTDKIVEVNAGFVKKVHSELDRIDCDDTCGYSMQSGMDLAYNSETMSNNRLLIALLPLLLLTTSCDLLNPPPVDLPDTPIEQPDVDPEPNANKLEGEYCTLERVMPAEIRLDEEFEVTVIVEAHQAVQSAFLEETGWFREFRRDRDTIVLWRDLKPGDKRVFLYKATMWSSQAKIHPWMTGLVSCNIGGLGESEVLELRSDLNLILD